MAQPAKEPAAPAAELTKVVGAGTDAPGISPLFSMIAVGG